MNRAFISGKIKEIKLLDDGNVFCKLHNEDVDSIFYLYWSNNKYKKEELENKQVSVKGTLWYINAIVKIKAKRILAIEVEEIVPYDI